MDDNPQRHRLHLFEAFGVLALLFLFLWAWSEQQARSQAAALERALRLQRATLAWTLTSLTNVASANEALSALKEATWTCAEKDSVCERLKQKLRTYSLADLVESPGAAAPAPPAPPKPGLSLVDELVVLEQATRAATARLDKYLRDAKPINISNTVLRFPTGLSDPYLPDPQSGAKPDIDGNNTVLASLLKQAGARIKAGYSIVRIYGHSDPRPYQRAEYDNYQLSYARARYIGCWLIFNLSQTTSLEGCPSTFPTIPHLEKNAPLVHGKDFSVEAIGAGADFPIKDKPYDQQRRIEVRFSFPRKGEHQLP